MQLSLLNNQNSHGEGLQAGFRLHRLEVYNWGGFSGKPWIIDFAGKNGLLTGANGSGKTTLVDAVLTLLVPNRKRNYNQAAGTLEKKDRNERSYVQGAYGGRAAEDSSRNRTKPDYLRKEGEITLLLAYFFNEISQKKVTLAQVLWLDQGVIKKFFVIAEDELSIVNDFYLPSGSPSELKKRLKANNRQVFEDFSGYSQKFIQLFGLQSDKALDLFNQAVGIKRIDNINDFVRDQMLEKADIEKKIDELLEYYNNLTGAYQKIEEDEKQLDILGPLYEEAEKLSKVKEDLKNLQHLQQMTPCYFAQEKLSLLEREIEKIDQQLSQYQQDKQELETQLEKSRQEETQLKIDIQNDTVGQRLEQLKQEIKQYQKDIYTRKEKAEKYNNLARSLNLPQYKDKATFWEAREQGKSLESQINQALNILKNQRDEKVIDERKLEEKRKELDNLLEDFRRRKNQIPKDNVRIRDNIIRNLNLDESDLPFIGELLKVREEAKEWEGAIERLLHNFGLSLVVPEHLYSRVNEYVEKTDLKGRLVYYKVSDSKPNPTQRDSQSRQVPDQLEINPNYQIFHHWLIEQLSRQFSYVCCDTIQQFNDEKRAITRNGLIKHGGEKHEKDDRYNINDSRSYILGWDNSEKIRLFEQELHEIKESLSSIKQERASLDSRIKEQKNKLDNLSKLIDFENFTEIDWDSLQSECNEFERQKQELEANFDHLKQLQEQLKRVEEKIRSNRNKIYTLIGDIKQAEIHQKDAKDSQVECQNKIKDVSLEALEKVKKWLINKVNISLTLDIIDHKEREIIQELLAQIKHHEKNRNDSERIIERQMQQFNLSFPEKAVDLRVSLEYIQNYLELREQIIKQDLPRHREDFHAELNIKMVESIYSLRYDFDSGKSNIEKIIVSLNEALKKINYTDLTYIQLKSKKTRDQDILNFEQDLGNCIGNSTQQTKEDNKERFLKIQSLLIQRFKDDEKWTKKVTDVRNWKAFSVIEYYRDGDIEKASYTDSTGKSGGEKTKLAYTIFTSAIAHQFGIYEQNWANQSLRFVVIDEVFSKLDPDNVLYVIKLFESLKLQFLFVTPQEQIQRLENYIHTLNFVWKSTENNLENSQIISMSSEKYKENRNEALKKKL